MTPPIIADMPGPEVVPNARKLLLPYVLGLLALSTLVHLAIALGGNEIDLSAQLLTGSMAVFFVGFLIIRWEALGQVRFGRLVAHAATYAIVNGGFQLHAAVLVIAGTDLLRSGDHLPHDHGWFGPTFAMAGFWALGLIIHAIASIARRGFED